MKLPLMKLPRWKPFRERNPVLVGLVGAVLLLLASATVYFGPQLLFFGGHTYTDVTDAEKTLLTNAGYTVT